MIVPEQGDFCCVSVGGTGGRAIGFIEKLVGGYSEYQHVFGYVGGMRVVEAESSGARIRRLAEFETPGQLTLWSTGAFDLTANQRAAIVAAALASTHAGPGHPDGPVGYSWLDYVAVGAAKLKIPAPHLRDFVKDSGHEQCAQLWDGFYQAAGVQLFDDGRWNGAVDPADMAGAITQARRA